MVKTRRTLREELTLSAAKAKETNVLHTLGYPDQRSEFFDHLEENRSLIQALAAHHLGLSSVEVCKIADRDDWIHGSFNVCVPIVVGSWKRHAEKRVIIRFPLPYRVGEAFRPGNGDEKLRCEAGAYSWLQENCPSVPIPQLFGFGLSTGQKFTTIENLPVVTRYLQYTRRLILKLLGYPVPSQYIPHYHAGVNSLCVGYLLIEYIEDARGTMLSNGWDNGRYDPTLRRNLFRGLSRILLTIAKAPVPRIGSFIIDDNGVLNLDNRPLSLEIQDLENEQIPVDISRNFTYSTVDSYVTDILAFHDNRLQHQPNAVNNGQDCIYQMSALTMMKTLSSQFFRRDLRRGPFVFSLTDLHQSNILVDENWNIKCIIDLEWACSRPIEMLHPPRWLTNEAVDTINVPEYDEVRQEFMEILEQEEEDLNEKRPKHMLLSDIMRQGWERGTFWYSLALRSPTGLFRVFYDNIQPRLVEGHEDDADFFRIVMYYWSKNATKFIFRKIEDKEEYDKRLEEAFED